MSHLSLTVLRCPDYGAAEQRMVRGVELTIGRGTECDWALPDPLRSLSRRHCRLEQVGAAWQVVDLSANGTFINFDNEPIGRDQAQPLRDGDRLRLGDYELEVRLAQPTQPGLGSPFGAAPPSDLSANLSPGLASNAGLGAEVDDALFAAVPRSGQPGSTAPSGGFGSARLPGLDDPVQADDRADALDLDISGDLGSFRPAPTPGFGAQEDHAAPTGDAFLPPAVVPQVVPGASAQPPAGQGIVPDDWLQSIALGVPGPVESDDPVFGTGPSVPTSTPAPSAPASTADGFGADLSSPSTGAVAQGFDDGVPVAPAAGRSRGTDFEAQSEAMPGDRVARWPQPVGVPPTGPGTPTADAPAPGPAVSPAVVPNQAAGRPVGVAPAPAPVRAPAGAVPFREALAALMAGGGLPADAAQRATQDPEAALRHAGALMQVAVSGLRALLVARGLVKREFRIEQTMLRPKENNPLKFAASDEHALASLLDPRMAGLKAVQDAVDDLSSHEVAVLAATQAAAHALLEKLSPAALEAEDPGGSGLFGASAEKRLWLAYKRRHATLMAQLEDDFDSAFGIAFARAYEHAVGQRKG